MQAHLLPLQLTAVVGGLVRKPIGPEFESWQVYLLSSRELVEDFSTHDYEMHQPARQPRFQRCDVICRA
jgi:hypothetical protein